VQQPTDVDVCTALYDDLCRRGIDVLYDDREGIQPGEKLADADLIGLPHRLVVSKRTLAAGGIEWKKRTVAASVMLAKEDAVNRVAS
jgi:prolyl-tRNA synthetase